MNIATLLIALILVIACGLALRSIFKNRGRGGCRCDGCHGCNDPAAKGRETHKSGCPRHTTK